MSDTISSISRVIDSLHSTPQYQDKGYSMVRVVDVNNEFLSLEKCLKVDKDTYSKHNKNHKPVNGDIIITRVGSYGMVGYVDTDDEFCLGQNLSVIHPKKFDDGKFLYYYILSPFMQKVIYGNIGGSAYKCLGLEDIRNLPLNVEGLNRRKIGDFLYRIDKKIDINQKIIKTLESMAKTLYDYWFVQFDFPDANGRPYKTSGGKMVWNEELGREIPVGWEYVSVKKVVDVQYGYPFDTTLFSENQGMPVVRIRDIQELSTSACTTENVDEKYQIEKKDLIVGMDGNFHMNFWAGKKALLNQRIFRIRGSENLSTLHIYWAIKPYIEHREKNVTRTTVGHLSDYDVKSLKIILPNDAGLRRKFADKFESILNPIINMREENWRLSSLRDYLLPMLMNGQVTFRQ